MLKRLSVGYTEYWFDLDVDVCEVAEFNGLQHPVQAQGAAITWHIES